MKLHLIFVYKSLCLEHAVWTTTAITAAEASACRGMSCGHLSASHTTGHLTGTWLLATLAIATLATAEDVELVDEVNHEVRVDSIGPRVATLHGVDDTAHVALLAQDVVGLKHHNC